MPDGLASNGTPMVPGVPMPGFLVYIYQDGALLATGTLYALPASGDLVEVDNGIYQVVKRQWTLAPTPSYIQWVKLDVVWVAITPEQARKETTD